MGVVAVVIIIVAAVVVIIIIIMQSAVASTLYDCSCILQHTHTHDRLTALCLGLPG